MDFFIYMNCKECKIDKELCNFQFVKKTKKYETKCKQCRSNRKYKLRRAKRIEQGLSTHFSVLENKKLATDNKKYCPICKEIKDIDSFSTNNTKCGIASRCKLCSNISSKERSKKPEVKLEKNKKYLRDKDKTRNTKLLRDFGISLIEYEKMLENQDYKCYICGKTIEENKKALAVDHCHKTGKVRDLLCSSCNICIGFIEKNNLDCNNINNYLIKHKNK